MNDSNCKSVLDALESDIGREERAGSRAEQFFQLRRAAGDDVPVEDSGPYCKRYYDRWNQRINEASELLITSGCEVAAKRLRECLAIESLNYGSDDAPDTLFSLEALKRCIETIRTELSDKQPQSASGQESKPENEISLEKVIAPSEENLSTHLWPKQNQLAELSDKQPQSVSGQKSKPRNENSLKKVIARSEEHLKRHPWPGQNQLAVLMGCSSGQMVKAVKRSAILATAKREYEEGRSGSVHAQSGLVGFDTSSGCDVAVNAEILAEGPDGLMARLVEECHSKGRPEDAEELLSKSADEIMKIAEVAFAPVDP